MSDSIDRLHAAVLTARSADPATSRTARLLQAGRAKVAKKLGEEAVEVVIDAMNGSRDNVVRESADLLYNLVVLWASFDVDPKDIWKEMDRRERMFGIAEKVSKNGAPKILATAASKMLKHTPPKSGASVTALAARRTTRRRSR